MFTHIYFTYIYLVNYDTKEIIDQHFPCFMAEANAVILLNLV